jgi:hypothetical protein
MGVSPMFGQALGRDARATLNLPGLVGGMGVPPMFGQVLGRDARATLVPPRVWYVAWASRPCLVKPSGETPVPL